MGKVKMIGTKKQEVKALVSIPYGKGKEINKKHA